MKRIIVAALVMALAVAGYFSLKGPLQAPSSEPVASTAPANSATKKKLEKVVLRLSWVHDLAYAGIYLAKDKGYFKRNGLDVSLEPGGFGLDPIKQVATGTDQFGIAGAGNLLLARAQGVPIVAIGIYFQRSGVGYFTRQDSGITSFKQFRGKLIGVQTGTDTDVLYRVLLKRNGMTSKDVHEVPIQYDMAPFLTKQIDVLPGYVTNQPIVLSDKGINVNTITADSEGLNYYGSVFFTTEKMIQEHPDIVLKFMQSLQQGWKDAFDHKDQAIEAAKRWAPDFDPKILPQIYDAAIPLIKSDIAGVPINGMDDSRWLTTLQVMKDSGMLVREIELEKAYNKSFTK